MRCLTVLAGALGAALLLSSGAFAQAPPNPNDNIPDTVPFTMPYGEPIDIATAKKAAAAAVAEVSKRNWGTAFCISGRRTIRPSGLFRTGRQLPVCIDRDLAAQGARGGDISASNADIRKRARQR